MSYTCNLFGELSSITMKDFNDLRQRLQRHMHLDAFEHHDDTTLILDAGFNNRRKISWLEKFIYPHIAGLLPPGRYEKLYFREGHFFTCVFFGPDHFETIRYQEPECPEWWQGEAADYIHGLKERIMDLLRKGAVVQ